MGFGGPFRRRRDGRYTVDVDPKLRTVLASVAEQLGPMIDADDPATTRLFPPAYVGEDTERQEAGYRALVDGALRNHHHRALDVLVETASAPTLTAGELEAWLSAIGSMRLVLGTRLDVSEDMDPPGRATRPRRSTPSTTCSAGSRRRSSRSWPPSSLRTAPPKGPSDRSANLP